MKKIHIARIKTLGYYRSLKLILEKKGMKILNEFIDTYKDYQKKGIEFKDVLGII